ncbi:hypothetical protein D3C78_1134150 [compost metagenome]
MRPGQSWHAVRLGNSATRKFEQELPTDWVRGTTICKWPTRVPACDRTDRRWLVRELATSSEVTRRDKSPGDERRIQLRRPAPAAINRPGGTPCASPVCSPPSPPASPPPSASAARPLPRNTSASAGPSTPAGCRGNTATARASSTSGRRSTASTSTWCRSTTTSSRSTSTAPASSTAAP